jgi:hypothetical protein
MVGFVPVGDPEAVAEDLGSQAKDAAAQPVSDASID